MSRIKNFSEFCLNESDDDILFRRHTGYDKSTFAERANDQYGLGSDPSALSKTESFFDRMEDRFNRASDSMQSRIQQKRAASQYDDPNTGVEILFGAASVVPSILKRVFGPTKFDIKKTKEEDIPVELIRHTNEDFVRNELPSIHSEEDLARHIEGLYGSGQVRVGQEAALDDIARNRVNIFYQRQANPNSPVLRVPPANQPAPANQPQPELQPNN